jgi:threonine synthase
VTTAVLAKLAEKGSIGAGDRVAVVITGEGLKTLDAVREGFCLSRIEPTLNSFEATFADAEIAA